MGGKRLKNHKCVTATLTYSGAKMKRCGVGGGSVVRKSDALSVCQWP